ncbi:cysteine peptidase family C39 domain-containing protein [Stenotrophomonas maltophilia]|uniref:cysteine peptidase family C39 domain-containing protein n=1 Tax=Stenotrophomonas maltophilia TaxID=40324 RepID=UPI0013108813|nr:hypothetical protein PGKDCPLP_03551 [Stenotrophomonas maltophilia]
MSALRRVHQRDWNNGDCGIACVAMLARVSYEEALEAFRTLPGKAKGTSFFTTHTDIAQMLAQFSIATKRVSFRSWRAIDRHAIVKVNPYQSGRRWHWVVLDAGRDELVVHDPTPGKTHLIRDFRGLKGSGHFIAVAD